MNYQGKDWFLYDDKQPRSNEETIVQSIVVIYSEHYEQGG